jgi:hypothetical protein
VLAVAIRKTGGLRLNWRPAPRPLGVQGVVIRLSRTALPWPRHRATRPDVWRAGVLLQPSPHPEGKSPMTTIEERPGTRNP